MFKTSRKPSRWGRHPVLGLELLEDRRVLSGGLVTGNLLAGLNLPVATPAPVLDQLHLTNPVTLPTLAGLQTPPVTNALTSSLSVGPTLVPTISSLLIPTPTPTVPNPTSIVGPLTTNLSGVLTSLTSHLTAPVTSLVTPVTGTLTSLLTPVTSTVGSLLTPVTTTVVSLLTPVTNGLVTPLLTEVVTILSPITTPVLGSVTSLLTPVTSTLGGVLSPVVNALNPILSDVTTILAPVTTPVVTTVTGLLGPVTQPVVSVVTSVLTPVAPVVQNLGGVVSPVTNPVSQVVSQVTGLTINPSGAGVGKTSGGGSDGVSAPPTGGNQEEGIAPVIGPQDGGSAAPAPGGPSDRGTGQQTPEQHIPVIGPVAEVTGVLPWSDGGQGQGNEGPQDSASGAIVVSASQVAGASAPVAPLALQANGLTDLGRAILPAGQVVDPLPTAALFSLQSLNDAGGGSAVSEHLVVPPATNGAEGQSASVSSEEASADNAGVDLAGDGTTVLADGSGFELGALAADVQQFLAQIDGLRVELREAMLSTGLYPWLIAALAVGVLALEVRRRRQLRRLSQGLTLALASEDGSTVWLPGLGGLSLRDGE